MIEWTSRIDEWGASAPLFFRLRIGGKLCRFRRRQETIMKRLLFPLSLIAAGVAALAAMALVTTRRV